MKAVSTRRQSRRTRPTFQNVLVCGSPRQDAPILLRQAMSFLQPGRAVVHLLELPDAPHRGRARRGEPLDRVADALGGLGITLRRERPAEPSAEAIVAEVIKGGHDLVMKGVALIDHDRRRRVLDRLDLGLIRRCPCPVWLVEWVEPRPLRRVLAAVNPGEPRAPRRAVAVRVAAQAAAFAESAGADLHVLHAWTAFGDHLLRPRVSPAELESYVQGAREAAAAALDETLREAGVAPLPAGIHLAKGSAEHTLPPVVVDAAIDLVVMGTRGRTGWLDSVIRPLAERVLCSVPASVFVVKGPGRGAAAV